MFPDYDHRFAGDVKYAYDFRRDVSAIYRELYFDLVDKLPDEEREATLLKRNKLFSELVSRHYPE